jgi:hypothetical protein
MVLVMTARSNSGDEAYVVPVQTATAPIERAVEHIFPAHYRNVYRYLLAMTRSDDEADEITAETFERALRAWSAPPESPLPWLLLTARRIARDRWRRARRSAELALRLREGQRADAGERQTEFWLWFESLYPFDSAVVLVTRPGSSDPQLSFHVVGISGPERVFGSADPPPLHIAELVAAL